MLYTITILLSAFLLFQVQPIIAKMILPWFGGSAAVWTTCLLFFQLLLVAGYAYAHWTVRTLGPRTQAALHITLLAAAALALPILPDAGWKPTGVVDPSLRILGLLSATVGLPYFLLASTSPLVQVWYARARQGAPPYRLYALSNLGSMLALITYPIVVEPWLPTGHQAGTWSALFLAFALACGALAWRSRAAPAEIPTNGAVATRQPLDAGRYVWWVALPAAASILLLAFTSHISQNVAPIPFLWILPLALYLLSFILCFEGNGWYQRRYYVPLLGAGFVGVLFMFMNEFHNPPLWVMVPLYCATLFVACMVCHGELARLKPHPRHLTGYFAMIAIGGALGGVFVGLIAPRLFNDLYELPIGMVLTVVLVTSLLAVDHRSFSTLGAWWATLSGSGVVALVLAAAFVSVYAAPAGDTRLLARNFYAAMRVSDTGRGVDTTRLLTHGTITHGKQYRDAARRGWLTTYYGEESGVGRAIEAQRQRGPIKIGVVGLGTGTLAAYGRPGDTLRFYELNPQVIDLARREFTYLHDSRATVEVVLGDARLSLEREPPQNFDVLAVDAFSSDAIPVHLLTAEAFEVYFRHLRGGGILAVHISNRYLDLQPVLREAAAKLGKHARLVDHDVVEGDRRYYGSTWVLFADSHQAFARPPLAGVTEPLASERKVRLWTDDYSELWRILK